MRFIQGASGASMLLLISLRTLPSIEFMWSAVTLVTFGLVKMKNRSVIDNRREALTLSIVWLSGVLPPTTSTVDTSKCTVESLPQHRACLRISHECRHVLRSLRSLWSDAGSFERCWSWHLRRKAIQCSFSWQEDLPFASGESCEMLEACLLLPLNSGSKKAMGKHEANELRQSPSSGRWRFNSSMIHSLREKHHRADQSLNKYPTDPRISFLVCRWPRGRWEFCSRPIEFHFLVNRNEMRIRRRNGI